MHDVGPVKWDDEMYASAKSWAAKIADRSRHSKSGISRPSTDGENLAGSATNSVSGASVDAANAWYSEFGRACKFKKSCWQSFSKRSGHFTAMIWKTLDRVAYARQGPGKTGVGRYRGCDDKPPNFNNAYAKNVPPAKRTYEECVAKVNACPALKGAFDFTDSQGPEWYNKRGYFAKKGQRGFARRYEIPEVLAPLMANPWPLAVASGLVFAIAVALMKRRRSRAPECPDPECQELVPHLEVEEGGLE